MVDWACVNGMAEEYGMGDPDFDVHDPAGHCGGGGQTRYNSTYHGTPAPKGTPPMPLCKRCGKAIEFIHSGVRWRIYEPGALKLHACNPPIDPGEFQPIKD